MAYIGQAPINGFHAKQSLTGDGSTVTFTLDQTVATETGIIVSVGGVLQEPSTAYDLTVGGTKITFTEAPSSTDRVYIHYLGKAIVQNIQDVNGAEFVLDANGNTSFHADTDDEIDIKVGGSDINTIKSTGIHNLDSIKYVAGTGDDLEIYHDGTNSLIANKTGALKIATETSGIAVTIGHSTSEVTIADNATVTGNLTVTGTLTQTGTQTFDGGIDVDNFNLNGTTLALSSGDMTVDVAGDIILDADGGEVVFKDAGTSIGHFANESSDFVIKSMVSDKDMIFQGIDGGTGIVALSLDMSAAGAATFNSTVTANAGVVVDNITIDGTEIDLSSGNLTIDVAGNITIDADGGTITFADAGSSLGTITSSGYSGTAAVASVATTVTITDNENTDENNAIIFAAGGDVDGGNLGLESDGDLTYNPSSGTLNVPNISVTGTQTIVNSVTMNANNAVIFEGATADAHETTLSTVDATADRTINLPNVSGTLPVLAAASATAITSTPEELNILDGVNSTAAELNIMDGGTSATSTTVADADRVVMNDNGTMVQVAVTDLAAYFDDEITAMPNLTSVGTLTALTVDNISINTSTVTASGDLIFDAASDIVLDADGGKLKLKDDGTEFGQIFNNSGLHIIAKVSDQDIVFKGNDGGSETTLLTLDSSDAGTATFNHDIILGDSSVIKLGAGADLKLSHDGSNSYIEDAGTGQLRILGSEITMKGASDSEVMMVATKDDGVDLYFNNAKKFETTNVGITVSGTAIATTDTDTSNTGNVTLDFGANQNFVLTLTGNVTLVNPTTEQVGQSGMIVLIQDGTGSRTLAVGDQYFGAGGSVPTISTAANSIDVIPYFVQAAGKILLGEAQKAFSDAS